MKDDVFSISQVNQFIKDVVNAGFPRTIWVCGEIQQYDRNKGKKHVFFDLVEKEETSDEIKARIGLVIFAPKKFQIDSLLKRVENTFELKDDIEVKFECKVDFYVPHGAVRLIVENIDPTYTLGRLAQEKQKLIALLKEKGVLDKNKTLDLPLVPLQVGLITADDSAAYNDFISELKKSGYGFTVALRNTLMQGQKAEKDVCLALEELNTREDIDLIVITRGGGSLAELSCFDSQRIAEKIAASCKPVLCGIGHEINTTIADLAAHTYCKTPTAVAQFLTQMVGNFLSSLEDMLQDILAKAQDQLNNERHNLKQSAYDLQQITNRFLLVHHENIVRFREMIKNRPQVFLKDQKRILGERRQALAQGALSRVEKDREKLQNYEKLIDFVHPVNTMKRGFSITRLKNGNILRQVSQVGAKDKITTHLADGIVESTVQEVS